MQTEIDIIRKRTKYINFSGDWSKIPSDATAIMVEPKIAKSLEPLAGFKKLQDLFVSNWMRPEDRAHVGSLKGLKSLLVGQCAFEDLKWMGSLRQLESFGTFNGSKLKSFSGIQSAVSLKHLYFYDLPKVHSLEPLSGLKNLEELVLQMSYGTSKKLTFESLSPLAKLRKLKCLDLIGVRIDDELLSPLANLPALYFLNPGRVDDIYELANLAAKLNKQLSPECQITPTRTLKGNGDYYKCKRCKTQQLMLMGRIGLKYRMLACPKCNSELIAEHEAIFAAALSKSKKKS